MTNEELAKQKYMEIQLTLQQIKQLNQHLELLQQQFLETMRLNESLADLEKTKRGSKMFASLGAGVFVEAELKNNERVLMNVGADTTVLKATGEARQILAKQVAEIQQLSDRIVHDIQQLQQKSDVLQQELKKLVE